MESEQHNHLTPEEMEALEQLLQQEENQKTYTPRPLWQRVMAMILAAIVIAGVILYYAQIMHKY